MRRRVFWAILGVVGVVLFLMGLTTAIVGRQASRERILNQLETSTQLVGRDLADRPLARAALRAEDEAAARIILNRADRSLQLDDGTSVTFGLLTTDFLAVADVVAALEFDAEALRTGQSLQLDQRIGFDQVVAVVRPVSIDDSPNLLLVIASRPLDRVRLRAVFRDLAIPLLVAAAIAAIGARLVSGSVVKRLADLRDATRLLGSGDWSARAEVQGSDEVAELAATFNSLAEFLEQASTRERAF
ncbi:MAG: HAMP domain-containing protein, partial [Acidimicrobiia bacterium]|nr:HAMP domain-containing protein [Acidimicrobiia bacterium]